MVVKINGKTVGRMTKAELINAEEALYNLMKQSKENANETDFEKYQNIRISVITQFDKKFVSGIPLRDILIF